MWFYTATVTEGKEANYEIGVLLRRAHRRAAETFNDALRPLEIQGKHFGVLLALRRMGPLSQRRLIEYLGTDKSSMVRLIAGDTVASTEDIEGTDTDPGNELDAYARDLTSGTTEQVTTGTTANFVNLGSTAHVTATATFASTMVQNGASITVTLGTLTGTTATAGAATMSKGARLRAALAGGEPLVLPVVESVLLARLTEIEGFKAGFLGGSARGILS